MQKPSASWYRKEAKIASLRRAETKNSEQLDVDFSCEELIIAARGGTSKIFAGPWTSVTKWEGKTLEPVDDWDEILWHDDEDCVYLELERTLEQGFRLQRQLVLARKDRFLYFADAVLGPDDLSRATTNALAHTFDIQLAEGTTAKAAKETREIFLNSGGNRVASIVPLALPEWHAEFAGGGMIASPRQLTLSMTGAGPNLYCPLWIDLKAARLPLPLTWRRLTVAENLEIQPRDVAVGYRMTVGTAQWLIYRSMVPHGNRTVLGKNYATEFVCTRFLHDGKTEDIFQVQ